VGFREVSVVEVREVLMAGDSVGLGDVVCEQGRTGGKWKASCAEIESGHGGNCAEPFDQSCDTRFRKPTHRDDMGPSRRQRATPVGPFSTRVDSHQRVFVPMLFPH
jgi:hypothetical protein